MLCNKKKAIHDAVGDETETTHLSVVDEIIGNEDLAFLIKVFMGQIYRGPLYPRDFLRPRDGQILVDFQSHSRYSIGR